MFSDIEKLLAKVNASLQNGLPGEEAHAQLAPLHRKPASDYLKHINDYKIGCVISLLVQNKNGEWCLVLMERASHEKDVHANQISFPGGKHEKEDASYYHTALRELNEELGVEALNIELISPLSELYIPPSNFLVKPFLCYSEYKINFEPNKEEVRSVLEIPLSYFLSPENISRGVFESARGYQVNAPFYEYQHHKIWGATAMMIAEIAHLLKM
ncbi:MAG: NUDIX hydrolase [Bacteroidota bacterium]